MEVRGAADLCCGLGVVGRGAPRLVREHRGSAPRGLTVPNELTNECLWGGSAPPNGSRLSCGRPARRRKGGGRQSVPRQGHNTPVPLKRSLPASFKRLLGSSLGARKMAPHPRAQKVGDQGARNGKTDQRPEVATKEC